MPREIPGGCRIPPRDVDAAIRHAEEARTWKDLAQAAYKKQLAPKSANPLHEVKRWGNLEKLAPKEKKVAKP